MVFLWLGYDSFTLQPGRRLQTNGQNRTTGSTSLNESILASPTISNMVQKNTLSNQIYKNRSVFFNVMNLYSRLNPDSEKNREFISSTDGYKNEVDGWFAPEWIYHDWI